MNAVLVVFVVTAFLGNTRSTNVNKHMKMFAETDNHIEADELPKQSSLRKFVKLVQFPEPSYVVECGKPVELTCSAFGTPAPTVHWFRNDAPVYEHDMASNELIDTESTSVGEIKSTLLVTRPSSEDHYTCLVSAGMMTTSASTVVYTEGCNGDLSERAKLFPQAPRIVVHYSMFLDVIGHSAVLPCRARGHPRPRVSWRDEKGNLLKDSRMQVLRTGELLISGIRWSDMGAYTCEARNSRGTAKATTFLYPAKAG